MIRLLPGDAREVLATLPADSVHCVVTSPPYYGLRDYGTALWDGGDAACDHVMRQPERGNAAYTNGQGQAYASNLQSWGDRKATEFFRDTCGKCGAVRIDRQIGLEPTPEAYLQTMVEVFREVRRVLRPEGTCWVNMGDSYSGGGGFSPTAPSNLAGSKQTTQGSREYKGRAPAHGYKPKDLLMMPARLALALQADGWWIRSDIIWHKPNPMPESCTDRPTSAHEHVFLLTRSARYFYDADAVREEADYGRSVETASWHAKADANSAGVRFKNTTTPGNGGSRNLRNVWTLATAPYAQAHFATYPPALAERCIRAGTSERGCCAQCGKPWRRVTEYGKAVPLMPSDAGRKATWTIGDAARDPDSRTDTPLPRHYRPTLATGWQPGCACESLRCVSCATVLDTRSAKTTHPKALKLSAVQGAVPAHSKPAEVLFQAMRSEVVSTEPLDHEGLDDHEQGLQAASETGPSERDGLWLRDGTPVGDGEEAGPASDLGRGSTPQEWRSAGQSDQQSGTDGKASARRPSKADLSCDMPTLSDGVSDARKCPHCGSDTEWATAATSPCVVLDCFAGAGTTLLVADRLQRDAIGVELNVAYTQMAMARVRADAPLFADMADAPVPEPPEDARMGDLFEEAAD